MSLASCAVLIMDPALAQQDPGGPAIPQLVAYRVDGDRIDASLTGSAGSAARGAALFASRQVSTCLLCHADPAVPQRSTGTIGPSLAGIGSRLTDGQIRLRIVDAGRVNPGTVMPSFYKTMGLNRVGRQWQDKPILDAAQVEDLVVYLGTLRSR